MLGRGQAGARLRRGAAFTAELLQKRKRKGSGKPLGTLAPAFGWHCACSRALSSSLRSRWLWTVGRWLPTASAHDAQAVGIFLRVSSDRWIVQIRVAEPLPRQEAQRRAEE